MCSITIDMVSNRALNISSLRFTLGIITKPANYKINSRTGSHGLTLVVQFVVSSRSLVIHWPVPINPLLRPLYRIVTGWSDMTYDLYVNNKIESQIKLIVEL